ncbi:hypothetical protein [Salegentibacter salarius]|uniref:Uncharacterized protein n=1 Tax=Salegentibacter salarius TaxID=435906 RepID=A0A2N0TPC4_9FLAO|nr:hypothetical protein [Salegentibacter salarius]OEY71713.1 hypothetical protein BHS39_15105 [Salegentibacter salarius]PKD16599.1 hypothetical protein APR40_15075 [Salegentibacter salarius]SLK06438.1 hypothetical protein SAMN05660445_03104 [Salegentibacter salarius]
MTKKILFLLLILASSVNAQNPERINPDSLNVYSEITELQKTVGSLEKELENQEKINNRSYSSISNQISAASWNLTIFGILFGVAALFIGVYVTYIERKIIDLKDKNETLLEKTLKTKEEVVAINDNINNNLNKIFLKIRREETIHILKRLTKIPEDIGNFTQQLLSRELERDDFNYLKEAYKNLGPKPQPDEDSWIKLDLSHHGSYQLVFFQHFLDLALKDEIIGPHMADKYESAIKSSFKNDMIKSTEDFSRALVDLGLENRKNDINKYFEGLSKSDFKNNSDIMNILLNSLQSRENQFKLFNLIEDEDHTLPSKLLYARILKKKYKDSKLTESEKITLENVDELIVRFEKSQEAKEKT